MEVQAPRTLDEALEMKAARPESVPIAGGTDLMIDLNFHRRRPPVLMDVSRLPELCAWRRDDDTMVLGAGIIYSRVIAELREFVPLVQAARSIGSPQIRNRGTVGGNVGTASPAGDVLPVLAAYGAEVLVASGRRGVRAVSWSEFFRGPKKTCLAPDELITGVRWRRSVGPGSFSKVGPRNAMVIAVASVCLVLDEARRGVRVALGSVGPTVLRAPAAEAEITRAMARLGLWDDPRAPLAAHDSEAFGERVAEAARPIDDVRGTRTYRRHACRVLARRALAWVLEDRRVPAGGIT
ncbi:MAG TPA: FAD binding domain-containing protein [bacterium]|nr:FAD binding domain-containing protein [bacterium]